MAPKIRPRAACARRGVLSCACLWPLAAHNLCSVHHFSSTCLESTCSSRTFSARTLPFVCRRHLSLLRVRNYFKGSVLERVLCRMQAFRATPPAPHFGAFFLLLLTFSYFVLCFLLFLTFSYCFLLVLTCSYCFLLFLISSYFVLFFLTFLTSSYFFLLLLTSSYFFLLFLTFS